MESNLLQFKCRNCNWQGSAQELDNEPVESCMGDDTIEVCPRCGSYDFVSVSTEQQ